MERFRNLTTFVVAICITGITSTGAGAATDADKCEAGKNKIAGSYFACRQKAEAKAILKMEMPDYSKCTAKFTDKFEGAETKGAGMCPDSVVTSSMNTYLSVLATETAAILSGAAGIPSCGDDLINAVGEQCDGADLGGLTCASFGHAFGDLQCSGLCDFDTAACSNCPGGYYLGECYVLGASGVDCNTACAAHGMAYDTSTLTEIGSFGSDVNCANALNAVGAPGSGLDVPSASCAAGLGCVLSLGARIRCASPVTDPGAFFVDAQRVCGCH